jgi:hypothetical protein
MRSPAKKGVSTSYVESQYDACLLKERGHAPLATFITTLSTSFCRRAFSAGTLIRTGSASEIWCSFLRASF